MRLHPPQIVPAVVPFEDAALPFGWDDLLYMPDYPSLPAAAIPERAQSAARGIARVIAETLAGVRGPQQLARWLSSDECRMVGEWTRRLRGIPVRLTQLQLVSVHEARVEGRLTFDGGEHPISATLRLDAADGGWRCGQLAILLPGMACTAAGGAHPKRI